LQAALEKKGHINGHHQAVPLAIGHAEIMEETNAPRHTLIFSMALVIEEDRAGIAGTNQLAAERIEQVLVVMR